MIDLQNITNTGLGTVVSAAPSVPAFPGMMGAVSSESLLEQAERQKHEEARQEAVTRATRIASGAFLYGQEDEFGKVFEEERDMGYLVSDKARTNPTDQDHLVGGMFAREGFNGDLYGAIEAVISMHPEDERDALRAEMREKCSSKYDAKVYLGGLLRKRATAAYEQHKQRKAEFERGMKEYGAQMAEALPKAVLTGQPLDADMMEKATRYGDAENVTASLDRARAAIEAVRMMQRGGRGEGEYDAAVANKAKELKEEWYGSVHWKGTAVPTDEDFVQQAKAEVGGRFSIGRDAIRQVVDLLRGDDKKLDERALALMVLALDADAQGQQSIDSKFLRNFGEGLRSWFLETVDFVNRGNAKSGVIYQGPDMPVIRLTEDEAADFRDAYSGDAEKMKGALSKIEGTRLSASDKAGLMSQVVTELGTVAGDSAPAILAGMMTGGVGGFVVSTAAMAPASMNRNIAQAYYEGKPNAELDGAITGFFDAAAEAGFGTAVRTVPLMGKFLDRMAVTGLGSKTIASTFSKMQGNAFARFVGDRVIGESVGELLGEEILSQSGSYITINAMRKLGVNMDAPEWKPFSSAWENVTDYRQSMATVAFCASLGLLGIKADMQAARQFSKRTDAMLAAGITPQSAAKLAQKAEETEGKIAELYNTEGKSKETDAKAEEIWEKEYTEPAREVYRKEVVEEEPEKLRDRLAKEQRLYMSDIEAVASAREGVLQAALREAGVLTKEQTMDGKYRVTVEDEAQVMRDSEGWTDGKRPKGYVAPKKEVEMTEAQLAAWAQYSMGAANMRRMRKIRSAALALSMAGKIDATDYASTIPLDSIGAPVLDAVDKAKGLITFDVLEKLSTAAVLAGEQGSSVLPGVDNGNVQGLGASLMQRLRYAVTMGELTPQKAQQILEGKGGGAAMRLPAVEGAASRIVYSRGNTLALNLAEDAVESMMWKALGNMGGVSKDGVLTDKGREWLDALRAEMVQVNAQVKAATGHEVMPGIEAGDASFPRLVEYFSHLAQNEFYQTAGTRGLSDEARRHVEFMDAALTQAHYLRMVEAGFSRWRQTKEGRAWQERGGTLASLLADAGHELARLYEGSRVTAEAVAMVEQARAEARAAMDTKSRSAAEMLDEMMDAVEETATEEEQGQSEPLDYEVLSNDDGSLYVKSEAVTSWEKAEAILTNKMAAMTELTAKKRRMGIKGKGLIAPDTNYEVFIMPSSIKEMLSGRHTNRSLDRHAHFTAAALADELWKVSRFLKDHPDTKNPQDKNLKAIHRRMADLEIDGVVYEIKLTAKEFERENDSNVLYVLKVEGVKKKSAEGSEEANGEANETSTSADDGIVPQAEELVKGENAESAEKAEIPAEESVTGEPIDLAEDKAREEEARQEQQAQQEETEAALEEEGKELGEPVDELRGALHRALSPLPDVDSEMYNVFMAAYDMWKNGVTNVPLTDEKLMQRAKALSGHTDVAFWSFLSAMESIQKHAVPLVKLALLTKGDADVLGNALAKLTELKAEGKPLSHTDFEVAAMGAKVGKVFDGWMEFGGDEACDNWAKKVLGLYGDMLEMEKRLSQGGKIRVAKAWKELSGIVGVTFRTQEEKAEALRRLVQARDAVLDLGMPGLEAMLMRSMEKDGRAPDAPDVMRELYREAREEKEKKELAEKQRAEEQKAREDNWRSLPDDEKWEVLQKKWEDSTLSNKEYDYYMYLKRKREEAQAEREAEERLAADNERARKLFAGRQLPESPKWARVGKKLLEDMDAIRKMLKRFACDPKLRPHLYSVHHAVQNGVENYVATDGKRMVRLYRNTKAEDGEQTYSYAGEAGAAKKMRDYLKGAVYGKYFKVNARGEAVGELPDDYDPANYWEKDKTLEEVRAGVRENLDTWHKQFLKESMFVADRYPNWRQVFPDYGIEGRSVDVSKYGFLEKAEKVDPKGEGGGLYTFAEGRVGRLYIPCENGGFMCVNPGFMADFVKLVKDLAAYGMSPEVKVFARDEESPVLFEATAGEWKMQHVLMPMNRLGTIEDGAVLFGNIEGQTSPEPTDKTKKEEPAEQDETEAATREEGAEGADKTPAKLEDAGRHIDAHKDRAGMYAELLGADLPEDMGGVSMQKYFPLPDFKKLVEDGVVTPEVACMYMFCRDSVGKKPGSREFKLSAWERALRTFRPMAQKLMSGEMTPDDVLEAVKGTRIHRLKAAVYLRAGVAGCKYAGQIGFAAMQYYSWTARGADERVFRVMNTKTRRWLSEELPDEQLMDFAAEWCRQQAANDTESASDTEGKKKSAKKPELLVGLDRRSGKHLVYYKHKSRIVRLKEGFDSAKEAYEYRKEHEAELIERVEAWKKSPEVRRANPVKPRFGDIVDYRGGRDVSNEEFMAAFGINGITYGNWVNVQERQAKLNATYDAFMDLAALLGISPRAISLGGELGVQFGASGRAGAAAHYRLQDRSINLTKKHGDGSLAHEWWHALDNHYMWRNGTGLEMTGETLLHDWNGEKARKLEAAGALSLRASKAFRELIKKLRSSDYCKRSERQAKAEYWANTEELGARAFEAYIVSKFKEKGFTNMYLADFVPKGLYDGMDAANPEESRYPYPTPEEMVEIAPVFDAFFGALEWTEDEKGNYVSFSMQMDEEAEYAEEHGMGEDAASEESGVGDAGNSVVEPTIFPWYDKYLSDKATPIVVNTDEVEDVDDLKEAFMAYYREELAGKLMSIGNTGWVILFPDNKDAPKTAAKGVRNKARYAAGKKIAEAIQKAYHWKSPPAVLNDQDGKKMGRKKRKRNAKTGSYEFFAYPITLNGQPRLLWVNGTTRKGRSEKGVLFYEFGVADKILTASPGWESGSPRQDAVTQSPAGGILDNFGSVVKGESQENANEGSSWSLALMDEEEHAELLKGKEDEAFAGLMRKVRAEVARLDRVFSNDKTPAAEAARALGQVQAMMSAVYQKLDRKHRPVVSTRMKAVEAYARMIEQGRVAKYGSKLTEDELRSFERDLDEVLHSAEVQGGIHASVGAEVAGKHLKPGETEADYEKALRRRGAAGEYAKRVEEETKAEQQRIIRELASRRADAVALDMLKESLDVFEAQLRDAVIEKVDALAERMAPKKLKNGKYGKGVMDADHYRDFVRMTGYTNMPEEEVQERMEKAQAYLASLMSGDAREPEEEMRVINEIAELSTFGALRSKGLEQVKAAYAALQEFALTYKTKWQTKLEDERNGRRAWAHRMAGGMGYASDTELSEQRRKGERIRNMLADLPKQIISLGQLFMVLNGDTATRRLGWYSMTALARGNRDILLREQAVNNVLAAFMERELGLKTQAAKNDFVAKLAKVEQTDIRPLGEMVVHELHLPLDEARRWVGMGKAERAAERKRMFEAAATEGVDRPNLPAGREAENVPMEEDIPLLREELAKAEADTHYRTKVHVRREYRKEERQAPLKASRDQLLNLVLTFEQPRYAVNNAAPHGYTPEVVDEIKRFLGDDVLAYGYEMRRLLEQSGLAEAYEAREGVPFPREDNYWPGMSFDASSRTNEAMSALDAQLGAGARYGMLITRVNHRLHIDLSRTATSVFAAACAQTNNYLCVGELTSTWRNLLANADFARSLKKKLGESRFDGLKRMLDLLDGAGVGEALVMRKAAKLVSAMQSARAITLLGGNLLTLAKQLTGYFHARAMPGVTIPNLIKHLITDRSKKGKMTYRKVLELPCFQARYRDTREFTELLKGGKDVTWSRLAWLPRKAMFAIEKCDLHANAMSMCALYNITWERLQRENAASADPLSEAEMEEVCERTVEVALDVSAQPLRLSQKSMFAALGDGNALIKVMGFMGSETLNKFGMAQARASMAGGGVRGAWEGYKMLLPMSLMEVGIYMLWQFATGAVDEDEEDKWLLTSLLTVGSCAGMLNSAPLIGAVVEELTRGYFKTGSYANALYDYQAVVRDWKKLYRLSTDDKEHGAGEWWQMAHRWSRHLASASGAWGGIHSTYKVGSATASLLQDASVMLNAVTFFEKRAVSEEKKEAKEAKERKARNKRMNSM